MKMFILIVFTLVGFAGYYSVDLHNDTMEVALGVTEQEIDQEQAMLDAYQAKYDSMYNIKTKSFSMPRNEPEDICCVELDSLLRRMDKLEYRIKSSRNSIEILNADKGRYQERVM